MTNWRIPKWLWDDYETITELEARIKELEEENARLKEIKEEDQPEINITP